MQLELILEEKRKKSTIGTNGNYFWNTKQTALINEVEEEGVEEVNALYQGKINGKMGQSYNPNYQNSKLFQATLTNVHFVTKQEKIACVKKSIKSKTKQ
jgi:hypothetical protein